MRIYLLMMVEYNPILLRCFRNVKKGKSVVQQLIYQLLKEAWSN